MGIDLLEVSKIQASHEKFGRRFLAKVLTKGEIAYCEKKKNLYQSLAARFAAKEAFKKALSHFYAKPIDWQEVEVVMSKNKAPELKMSPRLRRILKKSQIGLSLSHTDKFAVAVVLISD
ncbi:MAG: holo-[acyl-carrier-protein] synthase [candidate division Zixibacteria bacterium RBG_16_50_21]|nr:MAG: holo-[acyl-carrier-protein] synthase [candidate division Zixibacteria bacterium RBG_16_50_21]